MKQSSLQIMALLAALVISPSLQAKTREVGPRRHYKRPCAAILAAKRGDTIEIDPGTYNGDVCAWRTNDLTIRGVGAGRPILNAGGRNSQGKGIWVIAGNNTTVENIEFTGAAVSDNNGAGIRQEGANLIVRNCYFHDNQEGILAGDSPRSTILVEFSEFAHNGTANGRSHNLYVNHVAKLIFRYNYSHESIVGHLLKSRAAENEILYNRLTDETTGTGSYELDLPNGGRSYVIGNLIEQGPQSENGTILAYMEEGPSPGNPDHHLFVVNNTFVNDRSVDENVFIAIGKQDTEPAQIENNIFTGPGLLTTQTNAVLMSNFQGDPGFLDAPGFDYHLQKNSPAIDAGSDPGSADRTSLTPAFQYVHPACAEERKVVGRIDVGAYEFGGATGTAPPNAPMRCTASLPPSAH
jgi:Right handed beta helix region